MKTDKVTAETTTHQNEHGRFTGRPSLTVTPDGESGKSDKERDASPNKIVISEHAINYKLAPEEVLVQCPYDASHYVRECRLNSHLFRCRKNRADHRRNQGLPPEVLARCSFSKSHWVIPIEIQFHEARCPYRNVSASLSQSKTEELRSPFSPPLAIEGPGGAQTDSEIDIEDKSLNQDSLKICETSAKLKENGHVASALQDDQVNSIEYSSGFFKNILTVENSPYLHYRDQRSQMLESPQEDRLEPIAESPFDCEPSNDVFPVPGSNPLYIPTVCTGIDEEFDTILSVCILKFSQLNLK